MKTIDLRALIFSTILVFTATALSSTALATGGTFTATSWHPSRTDAAPTITGSPPTTVQTGSHYQFTPVAADTDSRKLTFSISRRPAWATFSASTGQLAGTPATSGTYSNIVIRVSDGIRSASLPAFAINVAAAAINHAPTISGTPASSVATGSAYNFTPSASDADHDMLAFTIVSKPAWATFSTATGGLSGTPGTSQSGSYLNIVISVSDGKASAALAPFAITVTQPAPSGTATLSWTAPTQNTDGSQLTDLAGYRVYHGTSPDALTEVAEVQGASSSAYAFSQLASGTHYFAVSAYTSSGVESALSGVGSKTIM